MTDEIMARTWFSTREHRYRKEYTVTFKQYDDVIAEFKNDKKAYREFLAYVERSKSACNQVNSVDGFDLPLTKILNKHLQYGDDNVMN